MCVHSDIIYTHTHSYLDNNQTIPGRHRSKTKLCPLVRGLHTPWQDGSGWLQHQSEKNIVNWESSSHFYPCLWLKVNNIMKCLKPQSVQEMTNVAGRNMTSMNIITPFISVVVPFRHLSFPHNDEAASVGMTLDDTRTQIEHGQIIP